MTALAVPSATTTWWLRGWAQIDERPPSPCTLGIASDGTWTAEVATFTLAGELDLLFTSSEGGQFCGPATVARSRADSYPLAMVTDLVGAGPLLVVAVDQQHLELPAGDMVDGEVVG